MGPLALGDDVAITELKSLKALAPLHWRQELVANQSGAASGSRASIWPLEGSRFTVKHNYWRAKVVVSDGRSGFEEHWCLLSVAASASDRTIEVVKAAVDDAVTAASYAHRFNANTAQLHAEEEGGTHDAETVVGVRVCIPVGCYVLGGTSGDVAQPGQAISIAMYPFSQARKFVFAGQEEFLELPHAFFHYVAWCSGGREVITDIQGVENEDGDVFIVDPVVVRSAPATIGTLLGAATGGFSEVEALEKLRFDHWHPRCGQLCKAFDPLRRSAQGRRHCGLGMPTCGVGGG